MTTMADRDQLARADELDDLAAWYASTRGRLEVIVSPSTRAALFCADLVRRLQTHAAAIRYAAGVR